MVLQPQLCSKPLSVLVSKTSLTSLCSRLQSFFIVTIKLNDMNIKTDNAIRERERERERERDRKRNDDTQSRHS